MTGEHEVVGFGVASSATLEGLGDVLELGVLSLNRELVIRGCNRWLATAAGCVPADLVDRSIFDAFASIQGGPADAALRGALSGATVVWSHQFHGYLLPLAPPAGHEQYEFMQQSARVLPMLRSAKIDGVVVLVRDVTERVARERALKQALRAAEVASQAKSEFLASMSHELRTPLSAIIGYMDLLLGDMVGSIPQLQRNYLGRVSSAARHLISIIEEILTFSRVEAGREELHPEDVDVVTLAREVEELLDAEARTKRIELRLSVPAAAMSVRTDVTKLRQILINLLGNAIKFTDEGTVTLELVQGHDRMMIHVRDTGPGIQLADAERIFDAFTQVDQSHRRTKGGTGLGLPVSRRLAHLLGGDLTVQSVVGEGTTFSLWLPNKSAA